LRAEARNAFFAAQKSHEKSNLQQKSRKIKDETVKL